MNQNIQIRDRARKLLEMGSVAEALSLLEKNLKDFPRDIDSIYLSGICCARSGNHITAEKYFKRAVKINRGLYQAYVDLGLSQFLQRKFQDAVKSYKKALAINPAFAPAHANLAQSYLQIQEPAKALRHARRCMEIDGANPNYLNLQGVCYRKLEQTEKAIDTFRKINTAHPQFYAAYTNLYETYRLLHDIRNAEETLLSAKAIFADQATVYLALGKFYEQIDRTADAKNLYAQGVGNCGDKLDLLVALARANRMLGQYEEGLLPIDKALAIDSAYQPAVAERCSFHILKGEFDEAYALLTGFIASQREQPLTPGLSLAYAHVCRLTDRPEESLRTLRTVLDVPGMPDEMTSVLLFSMGDSYDKDKQYDRAFTAYRKANSVVDYTSDIDRYLEILSDIESGVRQEALDSAIRSDFDTSKPVFIVGMPRSGTSLVEQIISSHPEVCAAGEITELWSIAQDVSDSRYFEHYTRQRALLSKESINLYAARYLAFIENLAPDASRITDKLPHNFMHLALIAQLFPGAHIIHCHRHPFDTCLSIYFKKFNDNHLYARNLSEIARFYARYMQLMQRWQETATSVFNLKYEALVANQETLSRDMIAHIGLHWDEKCLRPHESRRMVITPSYTQANRPVYSDSISRWKAYQRHLQPLIDVLGNPEQYE